MRSCSRSLARTLVVVTVTALAGYGVPAVTAASASARPASPAAPGAGTVATPGGSPGTGHGVVSRGPKADAGDLTSTLGAEPGAAAKSGERELAAQRTVTSRTFLTPGGTESVKSNETVAVS